MLAVKGFAAFLGSQMALGWLLWKSAGQRQPAWPVVFVTPAGVAPEVLDKPRAAYHTTIEDPEVAFTLRMAGIEEVGAWTPARIAEQVHADLTQWDEVIRKANIRL